MFDLRGSGNPDDFRAYESAALATVPPASSTAGGTAADMRTRLAAYSKHPLAWPSGSPCAGVAAGGAGGGSNGGPGGSASGGSSSAASAGNTGGCGCRTTRNTGPTLWWLPAALLAAAATRRRSRAA